MPEAKRPTIGGQPVATDGSQLLTWPGRSALRRRGLSPPCAPRLGPNRLHQGGHGAVHDALWRGCDALGPSADTAVVSPSLTQPDQRGDRNALWGPSGSRHCDPIRRGSRPRAGLGRRRDAASGRCGVVRGRLLDLPGCRGAGLRHLQRAHRPWLQTSLHYSWHSERYRVWTERRCPGASSSATAGTCSTSRVLLQRGADGRSTRSGATTPWRSTRGRRDGPGGPLVRYHSSRQNYWVAFEVGEPVSLIRRDQDDHDRPGHRRRAARRARPHVPLQRHLRWHAHHGGGRRRAGHLGRGRLLRRAGGSRCAPRRPPASRR